MTPEEFETIKGALDFLPPSADPPDTPTRRLRIETEDGDTILAALRVEGPHPLALIFMGFVRSPDKTGLSDMNKFAFFDFEGGGLGVLRDGGTIYGPVVRIWPEVAGGPRQRPRRFPPLRLATSNGRLVARRRARRTKAK